MLRTELAGIEMPAGVNQEFADAFAGRDRPRDWGGFDELWPGADDSQEAQIGHATPSWTSGRKRACCNMQRQIVSRLPRVHSMVRRNPSRSDVAAASRRS